MIFIDVHNTVYLVSWTCLAFCISNQSKVTILSLFGEKWVQILCLCLLLLFILIRYF